ncbi:hypothetical protein ACLOJK_010809 [Asimina triloba]
MPLRVFNSFNCDNNDMVVSDELCPTLHRLGFKAVADKQETTVKSHIKPDNLGLVFNDFIALDRVVVDDNEVAAESGLSDAFKAFNKDDDRFILARDLQSILQKLEVLEGRDMDCVELKWGSGSYIHRSANFDMSIVSDKTDNDR